MKSWAWIVAFAISGASIANASEQPRRFALVIAQNRGVAGDKPLRYADLDARNMAEVLRTVGGVRQEDLLLLPSAHPDELLAAMTRLEARLKEELQGRPGQLVVYVSSHASRHQLHLDGEIFKMSRLRNFIQRVPVDLGVLIVDTCEAGSITDEPRVRIKGAEPVRDSAPNVFIRRPAVSGRVIITSSGANEYSHESEELRGSVFTHHLIAGLRGVADVSGDGNVSLGEAYEYAYVRTAGTAAQHPNWEVLLRGQGDPILTTPRLSQGVLRISVPESGEWLLRSVDGRGILTEFEKGPGKIALAVPPGTYEVQLGRRPSPRYVGRIQIKTGEHAEITRDDLGTLKERQVAIKGQVVDPSNWSIYAHASVRPPMSPRLDWLFGAAAGVRYQWSVSSEWAARLSAAVSVHDGTGESDLQHLEGQVFGAAGFAWRGLGVANLVVSIEGGAGLAHQQRSEDSETNVGFVTHARLRLGVELPVASWLVAEANVAPGFAVYDTPEGMLPLFQIPVSVGASAQF